MSEGEPGSSPRSWGTPATASPSTVRCRFIPTLVGNTPAALGPARPVPVHPHARGEHCSIRCPLANTCGSSPRSWGTRGTQRPLVRGRRFIPTLVGNTTSTTSPPGVRTVHPHARGEHLVVGNVVGANGGSSPRSWGTHHPDAELHAHGRFIPTLVGNTAPGRGGRKNQSVHPHARGEHQVDGLLFLAQVGSSPRSWGTPALAHGHKSGRRFIPTLVGNTIAQRQCFGTVLVHPHARGEHRQKIKMASFKGGSSPRSWGTRAEGKGCEVASRFIPTLVGNTGCRLTPRPLAPVHPHARGEHPMTTEFHGLDDGSSPRSWGTRFL